MIDTLASRVSSLQLKTGFNRGRDILLLALLGATLMMPVSYRAGTDQAHVHAIFQPMLDGLLGEHHHHGDEAIAAPSPFSSPAVPLTASETPPDTQAPRAESDVPSQVEMAGAGLAITAILGLGQLIATLLAGSSVRPLWNAPHHLRPMPVGPEPPPPRC